LTATSVNSGLGNADESLNENLGTRGHKTETLPTNSADVSRAEKSVESEHVNINAHSYESMPTYRYDDQRLRLDMVATTICLEQLMRAYEIIRASQQRMKPRPRMSRGEQFPHSRR